MKYTICNKEDMSAIAKMEQEYIECPWSESVLLESFALDSYIFIKAEENDTLIGYGSVQVVFDEGNINNIAVDKNFRHKGIASGILTNIIEQCKERKVATLFLEVSTENKGAIALYEKFGFKKIAERKNYYKSGSAIIMSKKI